MPDPMPDPMRVLMVGAGGVGDAPARIAVERDFFEAWVVADYDLGRAEHTVAAATGRRPGEERFSAAQVDASDADAVTALAREVRATHVFNAVDPRFVMPIFTGALAADADYLDMAMSLSVRHPDAPYEKVGVKLGDEQFARAGEDRHDEPRVHGVEDVRGPHLAGERGHGAGVGRVDLRGTEARLARTPLAGRRDRALGAREVVVGDHPCREVVALHRDPGRCVTDASGPDHQHAHRGPGLRHRSLLDPGLPHRAQDLGAHDEQDSEHEHGEADDVGLGGDAAA